MPIADGVDREAIPLSFVVSYNRHGGNLDPEDDISAFARAAEHEIKSLPGVAVTVNIPSSGGPDSDYWLVIAFFHTKEERQAHQQELEMIVARTFGKIVPATPRVYNQMSKRFRQRFNQAFREIQQ